MGMCAVKAEASWKTELGGNRTIYPEVGGLVCALWRSLRLGVARVLLPLGPRIISKVGSAYSAY